MNLFNTNTPIFSNIDFYDINNNSTLPLVQSSSDFLNFPSPSFNNLIYPENLNSNHFDSNENFFNINDLFINPLIRSEKQSEIEKNNEESSIYISSNGNKISDNSKSTETAEKPKKKKIFKEIYSNDFTIFNYGINDNYSKKMIYEALNEENKDCKNVNSKNSNILTKSPKRHKKKKKNIQKRKQNSDNIRKKIKARFLKSLKNEINKKLKRAGSKYTFSFLPQSFVCNLSKEKNKEILDLTLKEILMKNFCYGGKETRADMQKYKHNLFVLNYLENNKKICEESNFNGIKNMKYSQIFNEYLESKEFGLEISTLKKEKENDKYIKDYIVKARNFLIFFNN